jgi:hypothetical protein
MQHSIPHYAAKSRGIWYGFRVCLSSINKVCNALTLLTKKYAQYVVHASVRISTLCCANWWSQGGIYGNSCISCCDNKFESQSKSQRNISVYAYLAKHDTWEVRVITHYNCKAVHNPYRCTAGWLTEFIKYLGGFVVLLTWFYVARSCTDIYHAALVLIIPVP